MEIVKKNILSIICGVVALLALVAVFVYPLDGFYEKLSQEAKQRADVQAKVQGLRNKIRSLPVFDLDNAAVAPKLTQYPSAEATTWFVDTE